LLTRAGGYLLQVEPRQLDAWRFEQLAAEGHQALAEGAVEQAAERLRVGLRLWRGRVLADVPSMPVVTGEGARLEAVRLAALETRIEAALALDRQVEVIPELEALVAEQPLREGVRRQLMVALYRAGRQIDALAAYRELRHRLAGELGVEPSPALQRLERAVLTGDPALQPAIPGSSPREWTGDRDRQGRLAACCAPSPGVRPDPRRAGRGRRPVPFASRKPAAAGAAGQPPRRPAGPSPAARQLHLRRPGHQPPGARHAGGAQVLPLQILSSDQRDDFHRTSPARRHLQLHQLSSARGLERVQ
jgi:hypothetical protein